MPTSTFSRISIINRYYRITRFYDFLKNLSLKTGILLSLIVIVFIVLEHFMINADSVLNSIVESYSSWFLFSLFYISETLVGFLPPEAFIAWSSKASHPWLFVWILAALSYLGGITAFYIGRLLYRMPSVRAYLSKKNSRHIENLKKWGGVFIFVGAMLPVPHSLVSLYAGVLQFKIKSYLLWALFRFARFYLYAHVVFYVL